jgi:chemotaxis protein CheD
MEITVGMGEIQVTQPPHTLVALGIGSCVAVVVYDPKTNVSGLAHIVLPRLAEAQYKAHPTRFADVAVRALINEMKKRGASTQHLRAKVFGGANMFPEVISADSVMDIGGRNITVVLEQFKNHDVEIVAKDLGGHIGRSILFDTSRGSARVRTASFGEKEY